MSDERGSLPIAEIATLVGLGITATLALLRGVLEYRASSIRLETQRETIKFMREMAEKGMVVDTRMLNGQPPGAYPPHPNFPPMPPTI